MARSSQVSWKKQLILAALLFVLGMTAYWLEYKHKPQKESAEEASKKIFALKDTQVQELQITDGTRNFLFECADIGAKLCKPGDNSKWMLSEPRKTKADDSNVNSLLSTLNNLAVTDSIDLKDEEPAKRQALLKEYGLDAGVRSAFGTKRVFVASPGGGTELYLGLTHPIGESTFAVAEHVPAGQKPSGKVDETKVYLVPNFFKSNFDHDLTYWRDKKLFALGAHEVESFKLDSPRTHVSGDRKDGEWTLHVKGEDLPGDIENIDNLLTGLTYLTAKQFAAEDKAQEKKDAKVLRGTKTLLTMTIQREKGTAKEAPAPETLILYGKGDPKKLTKLYATLSTTDPIYEIEPYNKDRLDKELKDLRLSKLITSMERFGAKKLVFEIAGHTTRLLNKDGKWTLEGEKGELDTDKIQGTLDKLSGNRIKDFLSGAAIPAGEKDGLKFTLGDEKNDAKRELLFWKAQGKLYAKDLLSKRNEAFLVDEALKDALPWEQGYFLKKAEAKK
ncbi:MAG: DUF4340 domain-containing protein [Bdellovibrionota bacterium]